MGHPHDKLEWEVPPQEGSRRDNRFRGLSDRLGSNQSEPEDRRSMVPGRKQNAHKLPGTSSYNTSSQDIPEKQIQDVSTPQYHGSGIHQQPGRNSLQGIGGLGKEPVDVVPGKESPHHSPTSTGCPERNSGCGVSDYDRSVIFNRITHLFGPIEMDLFASRLTAQCPAFFSWRPDPYAVATDAFLQDWSQIKGYANPPWSLIGRVLSKVQMDKARIVLVAPVWKTQPWYPPLLQMLLAIPRLINHDQIMLNRDPEDLVPQLAAWHISGRDTETKSFRRKLPHSCSGPGGLYKTNKSYDSLFGKWHSSTLPSHRCMRE